MKITGNHHDGAVHVRVAGELDMDTAGALDSHIAGLFGDGRPQRLVVDVSELRFCDSAGIHAFLRARDAAHRHGAAFELTAPTGMTRRTLEIAGVLELLTSVSPPGAGSA